jgi:uncharacterized membrane protein YfcA
MDLIIGIVIGFAIGATGIGGGTLMAPALVFALGFSPRAAVATALVFSSFVKVLASGIYLWQRKVDAKVLAYLVCGGVPGAVVGAIVLEGSKSKTSEPWVLVTLGIIVVVSAGLSLFHFAMSNERPKSRLYLVPLFSFMIGSETGFSSAGAGALGTVMLFNLTTLAPSVIVGTDLVFGLIISTLAGSIHIGSCAYQTESSVARGGDDCVEKASRGDGAGLTLHTVTWIDDARCM